MGTRARGLTARRNGAAKQEVRYAED
jgi:hypothetical protein